MLFTIDSFCFPFKSSVPSSICLYKFSIVPYFLTRLIAVLGPIPGTPGILSDVSPCKPFTSINDLGSTPYSSNTFCLS